VGFLSDERLEPVLEIVGQILGFVASAGPAFDFPCQPTLDLVIQVVISMRQVTVAGAKAPLSNLLDAVSTGEPVLITLRGTPIAELMPRRPVRDLLPRLQALREALAISPWTVTEWHSALTPKVRTAALSPNQAEGVLEGFE
jgi:prevent-host-death family protein